MENKALDILNKSKFKFDALYSSVGSIGKRYRKSDEIGIPLEFTVDYQTLEDDTLTVRDRDTMEQFRVKSDRIDELISDSSELRFTELKKKYAI